MHQAPQIIVNLGHAIGALSPTHEQPSISWFQAIVIGIVQGLTEFLPISSSAHLRIVPALLGWGDPGAAVSAVVQLGTTAALLVFFRADILRISRAWASAAVTIPRRGIRGHVAAVQSSEARRDVQVGWYVIVSTIPIGIAGLALKSTIETQFRSLSLIGALLIVFGLLLWWADATFPQRKTIREFTLGSSLAIGVAQMFALIPGVSRSGATITAGRVMGFSREAAARFSFLLGIPAITLAGIKEAADNIATPGIPWGATVVATALAFISGYATIAWLLKFLVTHSTRGFALYRVVVGGAVLVLALTEAIS